ncbi:MAG: keto-deoxy-phosphogluconate aldolase, partial [Actinobacteria bacterium]|nr:keto-deoxy-phosphogluconate aldolase [Actinomycetota bacterium]
MSAKSRPWSGSRIVPLVVIDEPSQTDQLLDALVKAGLTLVEIALRTPQALESVKIAAKREDLTVAAGTVLNASQF